MLRISLVTILLIHAVVLHLAALYLPVHWDEGWNLCVARTWLEQGHYGCLFEGQLTTRRMSTGWPAVSSVYAGFALFGVSIFAGRIVICILALVAIWILYLLAKQLYGSTVALVTMALLLLGAYDTRVHPLLLAAHGNAELLCCLGIGLGFLVSVWAAKSNSRFYLISVALLSGACFGYAMHAKVQSRPFILVSLLVMVLYEVRQRRLWHACSNLFATVIALLLVAAVPISLFPIESGQMTYQGAGVVGLAPILGLNVDLATRLIVAKYLLVNYWFFLLIPLGIIARYLRHGPAVFSGIDARCTAVGMALFSFVALWLTWFVCLSIDFPRYFAPVYFFSSIFGAELLRTVTGDFSIESIMDRIKAAIELKGNLISHVGFLGISVLAFITVFVNVRNLSTAILLDRDSNRNLLEVIGYLNRKVAKHEVIETYESQSFFALDRKFRYPPDQLHVKTIRNKTLDSPASVGYDFLEHKPDWVLVGNWSRHAFGLYRDIASLGEYVKVYSAGSFDVYRLRRP